MKIFRRIAKFFISPLALGIAITLGFAFFAIVFYSYKEEIILKKENPFFDYFNIAHQITVDMRLQVRGPKKEIGPVAILAVDEASLEKFGHWPWPRNRVGEAVVKRGIKHLLLRQRFCFAHQFCFDI